MAIANSRVTIHMVNPEHVFHVFAMKRILRR